VPREPVFGARAVILVVDGEHEPVRTIDLNHALVALRAAFAHRADDAAERERSVRFDRDLAQRAHRLRPPRHSSNTRHSSSGDAEVVSVCVTVSGSIGETCALTAPAAE
jgi:hypothetical protein